MVNKFKDFLNQLGSKILRKRGESLDLSDQDKTGDFDLPPDVNQGEESEVSEPTPRFKLQSLNRLSPYTHKLKVALAPLIFKLQIFWKKVLSNLNKTDMGRKLRQTDWGSLSDKLLSKESFTQHNRAFIVAIFVVSTYSVGKMTALILKGRPMFAPPASSIGGQLPEGFNPALLGQVKSADPFKTKLSSGPTKISDANCLEATDRTNLPIKLVNTIVLQDSVKSIAAVQLRSGRDLKQVREGDTLDGMAKISRIARLELIIKNLQTGACESVPSDKARDSRQPIGIMSPAKANQFKQQQKIKGIENDGNKYVISKDLLDEKLKDISKVLSEARAIKIQNPDGTLAFKITEIEPGGIFSYLGIQNEDTITSINGKPITDLNEIMSLFGRIKNIDQLQLGVKREGEETQMDYQMKK